MQTRILGKTGFDVSTVSLGTWQVGGKWGAPFDHKSAEAIVHRAIDLGVNFIDTADVYSDGLSEEVVGRVVRSRSEKVYVATKCGRRLRPHVASGYNAENIGRFIDDSLRRTGLDVLDLVQLHCPPPELLESDEVFQILDQLKQIGKIRHYGVSVELVSEALSAIRHYGVATIQIIFNLMRQKPAEEFFSVAREKNVGIIARVPLASGLLTGTFSNDSQFGPQDHRTYNRKGEAFDRGETFSGVDYELGLQLVEEHYRPLLGSDTLAQNALRWVLMFDEVSTVIPGASSVSQVDKNVLAADAPALSLEVMTKIKNVYDRHLRALIHPHW